MNFRCRPGSDRHSVATFRKLGERTKEIRPVGAWVEKHRIFDQYSVDDKFITDLSPQTAAVIEENKIRQKIHDEKTRVAEFTREVRKRVHYMEKEKHLRATEEQERLNAAENALIQRLQRPNAPWTRTKSFQSNFSDQSEPKGKSPPPPTAVDPPDASCEGVSSGNFQASPQSQSSYARQKLLSRMVVKPVEEPPPPHPLHHLQGPPINDVGTTVFLADYDDPLTKSVVSSRYAPCSRPPPPASFPEQQRGDPSHPSSFSRASHDVESFRSKNPLSTYTGPDQMAVCRRIYAKWEREWVRENNRSRHHHQRISRLKEKKEALRNEVERALLEKELAADLSHSQEDALASMKLQETIRKRKEKLQRDKENSRYLKALEAQIRSRFKTTTDSTVTSNVIPAICSCHSNPLQAGTNKCANNCVFYQNPGGYTKALQSVLKNMQEQPHQLKRK